MTFKASGGRRRRRRSRGRRRIDLHRVNKGWQLFFNHRGKIGREID